MTYPHTLNGWIALGTTVSTVASVVCNLLPNANWLDDYPRAQKAYRTAINGFALVAINIRHCLPSLDIPAPALGIHKPLVVGDELPPKD